MAWRRVVVSIDACDTGLHTFVQIDFPFFNDLALDHGAAFPCLPCRWALWPRVPTTWDHALSSWRAPQKGFHQPTSHSKAAIPQDCYPCCRGSTTSNRSCISAEHPREAIPHHLCLPKAHLGHWWASFFFRKSTLPSTGTMLESPFLGARESPQASSDRITCDLTLEAMMKQPGSQSGKANSRLQA
ncbi:unnamed protein product [Nyctereutes procyonoides]|uniref:(raccoon dog) hypothetical protein n=1 Tax=Nyctereutes procyonoides TaxID=34880 RepID=A0A811XSR7_NYCPR|nr:unnamed protein product [Nyctereutes procyonoides]